ncbi:putative RNA-binding protein [Caldisphaera lagunensis DSM 15908]|uniref:Protein pelota homolog n=1 Tax=Caldisphaera lagunensis (strain DSM 15908 / JCM 11604 / ANMR 0165 / IC-154) TaxID=1056495 RepID=L0A7J0_CALLD|nr:pelota family protein [Caldisphaera lagunensis]AFZ69838.1 putative RNA-binding protein [Caldisphaera lagunensis DSM 15908]
MKIEVEKNKEQIKIIPESEEDLWNLMLILKKGDYIYTKVFRDVSMKNSKRKERKPIDIKLKLENAEFQPLTGKLRIFGTIEEGPEQFGVKGRHQSGYISLGQEIIIERKEWDEKTLNKLKSSGPKGKALIIALDYDEYAISLITSLGVYNLESSSFYFSGKEDPNRENEIESALNDLVNRIIGYLSKERANVLIIAGPGNLKEILYDKIKKIVNNIKIIIDNVSNGGIAGINEVLRRDTIIEVLKEFSSIKAQEIVNEFMMLAAKDKEMIAYTLNEVYNVSKLGAISKLVILDKLIYSIDDKERTMAQEIIENAEKYRADVVIATEDSLVSPTLSNLGGVIAILRYKLPKKNY